MRGSVQTLAFILHPTPSGFTTNILYVNDHVNDNGRVTGGWLADGDELAVPGPIIHPASRWILGNLEALALERAS